MKALGPNPEVPQVAAQSDSSTVPTSVVVATAPTSAVEVGDPESTRRINRVIVALLGLAVLFAAITVWFWRVTRPVAAHLEGLEIIGRSRLRAGHLDRLRRARGTPPKLNLVTINGHSLSSGDWYLSDQNATTRAKRSL